MVDNPKKRKEFLKMLDAMKPLPKDVWCDYLKQRMAKQEISFAKKVSSLLEASPETVEIVKLTFDPTLRYLDSVLNTLCTQKDDIHIFGDADHYNATCINTTKLCLQMFQYFPDAFLQKINTNNLTALPSILESLFKLMATKGYPKDCSWLAGTAICLIFNLEKDNTNDIADNFVEMLKKLECNVSHQDTQFMILIKISFNLPSKIDGVYGQISLINGLLSVAPEWLLTAKVGSEALLTRLLHVITEDCMNISDPTTKYLSFKTIHQWTSYLSTGQRPQKILHHFNENLFLNGDGKYMKILVDVIKNHIEDLVDGVPQFCQKIFNRVLFLHNVEVQQKESSQKQNKENTFISTLAEKVFTQGWFMKGRWMLVAELVPYFSLKQLREIKDQLSNDLIKCLNTCSLPAVSNEVYQVILKHLRRNTSDDDKVLLENWAMLFEDVVLNALTTDSIILRQNLGQYWLPPTCIMIPDLFVHLEKKLKSTKNHKHFLHSYMLLIKSAWNAGHLKMDQLSKRKDVFEQGLKSLDIELRMETFNVVCSNTKKTEPFPVWLQDLVVDYVRNNQNCDSSKFRQQMFSALKKLLMIVRDSSVTLHRKMMKTKQTDTASSELLQKQIDFIEDLFEISRSSLITTATFQRKKTGLQMIFLLTEIFVFVKDQALKKKCSPPESSLSLLNYVQGQNVGQGNPKWKFIKTADRELLACLENQHDEIRDLACGILCFQQQISDDYLLRDDVMMYQLFQINSNLMNSPRYHETESAGSIVHFISHRLSKNLDLRITNDVQTKVLHDCNSDSSRFPCHMLLESLTGRGKELLQEAYDDLLMASTKTPLFGISISISNIMKNLHHYNIDVSRFHQTVASLLQHCSSITDLMTQLLAGVWMTTKDSTKKYEDHLSPSFADMDEALDVALKSCQSYISLSARVGHLHCRELLLSFCWLNLKAISFIMAELGHLTHRLKKDFLVITESNIDIIEQFFQKTLIQCRHKGVIENSLVALTKFTKSVSSIPLLWKQIVSWCDQVLTSSTNLTAHLSVTKRSAGIPMFIQAILAAEPPTNHFSLLNQSIEYLFKVASTKLPTNTLIHNDLPQFNAINILRSIFRNATLNNAVMQYVERGVVLTIDGFSSPSWSIRNASTQLLGTLVPRMLGQRLSQEESSQQNMSTTDVFFYKYPKLQELFKQCLSEQNATIMENKEMEILPHLIPVLIFLSKLRTNDNKESERIYECFYPLLRGLQHSSVFTIRDLVASSIISITPQNAHSQLVHHIEEILTDKNSTNNNIYSCYLLCNKLLKVIDSENVPRQILSLVTSNYITNFKVDYMTHSLWVDLLIKLVHVLHGDEQRQAVNLLFDHVRIPLQVFSTHKRLCIVGQSYLEKSLANGVVKLLKHPKGLEIVPCVENLVPNGAFVLDFFESLVTLLDSYFCGYDSDTQYHITELISKMLENDICVVKILKFELAQSKSLLQSGDSTQNIFTRLLAMKKRYMTTVLPSLSKILSESTDAKISPKDFEYLFEMIHSFSLPTCDENKRMASAQSIAVMETMLRKEKDAANEKILTSLWWTALHLLQDEDEDIRNEATKNLQFLNIVQSNPLENNWQPMQCNITLRHFFSLHKMFPSHERLFMSWLSEVICKEESEKQANEELMLFEQEASNLYAEETVIVDLICQTIADHLKRNKDEDGIIDQLQIHALHLKSKVIEKETAACDKPKKSINDLYQERITFTQTYKCLKLMEICAACCHSSKTFKDSGCLKWIPEIFQKFAGVPSIRSSVQSLADWTKQ
ncbi:tRNA (32-2'-O)-methyltransferase regulator THADA-like [Clytia hemisphaerica]